MPKADEPGYETKAGGERQTFSSGMVRDGSAGKIQWWRIYVGPLVRRFAAHVTAASISRYKDVRPGVPNWSLAEGEEELQRARDGASRHFAQWMNGETDEDHAAAVVFNMDVAEYVKDKLALKYRPPVTEPVPDKGWPSVNTVLHVDPAFNHPISRTPFCSICTPIPGNQTRP